MYLLSGYMMVKMPEHATANYRGYVPRCRLVLEEKLGRPLGEGMETHHVNGIKDDDRPENLVEISHREHARLHSRQNPTNNLSATYRPGELHPRAKLTEKEVLEIKDALTNGARVIDLAQMYGVSDNAISHIKRGRRWQYLEKEKALVTS